MAGFRYDVFRFALVLATSLTVVNSRYLHVDKEPGLHLEHECVRLHSVPEEGVPVIMLHGLTDVKETWHGIYQTVAFLSRRRVCIYDARNHGDSGWNDTFNIDALSEDLGDFMRSQKIEKAAIVGHSLGGLTAMKFALNNPSKVEKAFVEDISPVGITTEASIAGVFYLNLLKKSISAIPKDADEETALKSVLDYIREATRGLGDTIAFRKIPFPFTCRNGVWQWKANIDTFVKAFTEPDSFLGKMEGRYDGKVFFLYGKTSMFKVADDAEAIRKLFPNAEFFGVEGAGHAIHFEYFEFLNQLIKFLK